MLVALAGIIPAGDVTGVSGHLQDTSSIPDTASCWVPANVSTGTSKGNVKPMSIMDDTENCDSLRFMVWNYAGAGQWQHCFDTAKKFIETCYDNWYAPYMFQYLQTAFQPLATADSSLYCPYQAWLESVLYLNTTNPEYFCACVEHFVLCPQTDTGGEEEGWKELNKNLAILRWLIQNTTCDTPMIQNEFEGARASQYEQWLNDTTVPLDTTIPPLDSADAGLDTLLARHFLYASVSETPQPSIISNATANPNPTGEGTVISFGISQEAYVKIELFDILGHEVGSAGFESLFEPGNKSVPLSLAGLPSGTYFARILTAYGEAQSVKLVKQ
jgi:hypothetical protein